MVGPCITQTNSEVGFAFRDRFLELGLRNRRFFVPSDKEGHYRFDLRIEAQRAFEELGGECLR